MKLIERLSEFWAGSDDPFMLYRGQSLKFSQIAAEQPVDLSKITQGDVVALISDFDPSSILTLLRLIDLGVVIVPLTVDTAHEHAYFFEAALVDVIIHDGIVTRRAHEQTHPLIDSLRVSKHAGLVLFLTGTTGRPKAILHDLTQFLKRFDTPRAPLRTLNFLLFDHIGGLNTLLHTLFNRGVVVVLETRTVASVLETCRKFSVEVLPTTPTFLRLMLMSGAIPSQIPPSLKVITYGTERMDQPTLDELCKLLPSVDFRQTFGMSELGIVRVKSEARNSLFMKIGGEGVQTKVLNQVLHIHSETRMLGYLNTDSPFDSEGWYDTKDIVDVKDGFYKITGRVGDMINVGGLKFMASEIERVALAFPNIYLVQATAKQNPITGQHVELSVQPTTEGAVDKHLLLSFLKEKLQPHMVPKRIRLESVAVGHRFKKA